MKAIKDSLVASEWGPWALLSGDTALNRDMNAVIQTFAKINDPVQVDGFWKAWDKTQTRRQMDLQYFNDRKIVFKNSRCGARHT